MNIDSSLLLRAAADAAGAQQYPAASLYVVATPIGNLADISLRALHVLSLVDALACEDTRVSAALLRHFGLDKPLIALHRHNEAQAGDRVLQRLADGQRVAYVSDAGTPAVSDPGAVLVRMAADAGHRVLPIPGASSALTALSVAGDTAAGGFVFRGFLPQRGADRSAALRRCIDEPMAQVLFEAPHRIGALAAGLAAGAPQRTLSVCRELTKQFETVHTLPAGDLPAWLDADAMRQRGEFVLVLHARAEAAAPTDALAPAAVQMLAVLLRELPLKQAVSLAAELSGQPRNALYAHALQTRSTGE